MLCALKKDFRCMFNWARTWNIISIITSCIWLAIYNWSCHSSGWINVVILLKGVGKNDYCCKKVPKFLRGFVKLIFGIKD